MPVRTRLRSQKPGSTEVRRQLRSRRNELSDTQRRTLDGAIRQHVLQLVHSTGAKSIAVFCPFDGEPDIIPLCRQWISAGLDVALPVISKHQDLTMGFHTWLADSRLKQNRYGIFEPQFTNPRPIAGFDMLMMPLVAYDRRGNRLGMGSGYYDRHLEALRDTRIPQRIGIAYSLQQMDQVDNDNWDIPLHGVVNEHGWFNFDKRPHIAPVGPG